MRKYIYLLLLAIVTLTGLAFTINNPAAKKKKIQYYFASGQNTSLEKTYRATSNVFTLDCEWANISSIRRQFSEYYKSTYSQSSTDYVSGACYGPFSSYDEANKKRNSIIDDQNYLCKSPKCVVTLVQGFNPSCK